MRGRKITNTTHLPNLVSRPYLHVAHQFHIDPIGALRSELNSAVASDDAFAKTPNQRRTADHIKGEEKSLPKAVIAMLQSLEETEGIRMIKDDPQAGQELQVDSMSFNGLSIDFSFVNIGTAQLLRDIPTHTHTKAYFNNSRTNGSFKNCFRQKYLLMSTRNHTTSRILRLRRNH
ncbi:hypothetical protein CCUS01_06566 [Colletotrichum cuscutae]|uniref:Uncharacterized protein n=1 Tax=Colletotrichum cuscutae TaxID=1209917 RepID=A0AAI9Y0Q7_9PEZI|nr:hypothetical protein CCUS01_06566 [Colletotrichum cuscutae]